MWQFWEQSILENSIFFLSFLLFFFCLWLPPPVSTDMVTSLEKSSQKNEENLKDDIEFIVREALHCMCNNFCGCMKAEETINRKVLISYTQPASRIHPFLFALENMEWGHFARNMVPGELFRSEFGILDVFVIGIQCQHFVLRAIISLQVFSWRAWVWKLCFLRKEVKIHKAPKMCPKCDMFWRSSGLFSLSWFGTNIQRSSAENRCISGSWQEFPWSVQFSTSSDVIALF